MTGSGFYRAAVAALAGIMVVLGLALVASGPGRGAGPLVYVFGALLIGAGVGRLWLLRGRRR